MLHTTALALSRAACLIADGAHFRWMTMSLPDAQFLVIWQMKAEVGRPVCSEASYTKFLRGAGR